MRRNVARLGLARVASALGTATAVRVTPLEYRSVDPPDLPGAGWHRVRTRLAGICGSDLSMIEGHASTYFDDVVSFPFVPGHEVVGELDDGTRVVLEPVLGHAARGFAPPFDGAAPGDGDDYGHLVTGDLEPGIQTGFCSSTGGGWSPELVAHESQLHRVGDDARRAGRAGRTTRRRHPRRPRRGSRRVGPRPPTNRSSPSSAPARWAWRPSPGSCATRRTPASSSAPATPISNARLADSAPTTSSRRASSPGPSAASTAAA